MNDTTQQPEPISLDPISGPVVEPITLMPGTDVTVGRSSKCDVRLADQSVSRMHAGLQMQNGRWLLRDLDSRHGTYLNGLRLNADDPACLAHGDLLSIGPWTLRVRLGEEVESYATTTEDPALEIGRIEAISPRELDDLTSHRLKLLMECASSIHAAADETRLARFVLNAVTRGTGFSRAALVRPLGSLEQVRVIASEAPPAHPGSGAEEFTFSRSLLRAASEGQVVRLKDMPDIAEAKSIIDLGIVSALCAPICMGSELYAFLYLDSRAGTAHVESDAAAFCAAVAQMCGLALTSINQRRLDADLRAARAAQVRMMPPEQGRRGGLRYAMRSLPGRGVAGDLFEVRDGHSAVMLGDVRGKGMGAAIIMAMTQSVLGTLLREHGDLMRALETADAYVDQHSAVGEFVSLWLGVVERATRTVRFIDAGHGFCVLRRAAAEPELIRSAGGLPLGVEPARDHRSDTFTYGPGDRLVLFSDGVVEQMGPDGSRFGIERVLSVLGDADSEKGDVEEILAALFNFAGAEYLDDDVTVASIVLDPA